MAETEECDGVIGIFRTYWLLQKICKKLWHHCSPSHTTTKKGQFNWGENAEEAFEALKTAMTTTPVLAIPNFNEIFVIEIDTSDAGI